MEKQRQKETQQRYQMEELQENKDQERAAAAEVACDDVAGEGVFSTAAHQRAEVPAKKSSGSVLT